MHEAEKKTKQITRAALSIIENLVKYMTAAEILAKLEEEGKKDCTGTKQSLVLYTIAGSIF